MLKRRVPQASTNWAVPEAPIRAASRASFAYPTKSETCSHTACFSTRSSTEVWTISRSTV